MSVLLKNTLDSHLSATLVTGVARVNPVSMAIRFSVPVAPTVLMSLADFLLSGSTGIQIGLTATGSINVWQWGGTVIGTSAALVTVAVNTFYNAVYTWDGTSHRLYVDNVLVSTQTTAIVVGVVNQVYLNGYPTGIAAETSASTLDEIAIYSKCLTANEISCLYYESVKAVGNIDNLIAYYRFNEGLAGTNIVSALDYSGNGNHLLPSGAGAVLTYGASAVNIPLNRAAVLL